MHQENALPAGTGLSKPEAVWRAIEELGYRADVTEILEHVRGAVGAPTAVEPPAPAPQASAPRTQVAPPAKLPDAPPTEPARKVGGQKKPRGRNEVE